MKRLAPGGSGYTHVSVSNVTFELATKELKDLQERGMFFNRKPQDYLGAYMFNQGIEKCVLQGTLRLLDYAYVKYVNHWKSYCDGAIQEKTNSDYETIEIIRTCWGKKIRSDHFPVLFTLDASFE